MANIKLFVSLVDFNFTTRIPWFCSLFVSNNHLYIGNVDRCKTRKKIIISKYLNTKCLKLPHG